MRKISIIMVGISIFSFALSILVLLLYGNDHIKYVWPYFILPVCALFNMIYYIVFANWINEKDNEDEILKQRATRINDRVNEQEKLIDDLKEELKELKEKINNI